LRLQSKDSILIHLTLVSTHLITSDSMKVFTIYDDIDNIVRSDNQDA